MRREGWGFIVFMLVLAWWIHAFSWRVRELEQRVFLLELRDELNESVGDLPLVAGPSQDSTPGQRERAENR